MANTLSGLTTASAQNNVEVVAKREQEAVQTLLPNTVERIVLDHLKNLVLVTHKNAPVSKSFYLFLDF